MGEIKKRKYGYQGQRDGHRHDQGAARAAQEQNQDQEDEADALSDRTADLLDGGFDQFIAVDIGHDLDAAASQPAIELGHLVENAEQRLRWMLRLQHQNDAFDCVGIGVLADNP